MKSSSGGAERLKGKLMSSWSVFLEFLVARNTEGKKKVKVL